MSTVCSYEASGEAYSHSSLVGKATNENVFWVRNCIYCGSALVLQEFTREVAAFVSDYFNPEKDEAYNRSEPPWNRSKRQVEWATLELKHCEYCGWWMLDYGLGFTACYSTHGVPVRVGKCLFGEAKHYAIDQLDTPIHELRMHLGREPDDLARLAPKKLELLMQHLFAEQFGAAEVVHVGGTGDGGVDLKMVLTDGETYLVQVKRRGSLSRAEGVQVVRELNGVLFREGLAKGMIVTTARRFTSAARRETHVRSATQPKYAMELLAFEDIVGMLRLRSPVPYQPWLRYVANVDVGPGSHFLKDTNADADEDRGP